MSAVLRFRGKGRNGWRGIPLLAFAGLSSEDAWAVCDGSDIVAEFSVDGEVKGYVCGTDRLVEHYRGRGFTAMRFKEALAQLWERRPELLEAICPGAWTDDVGAVFPGSEFEEVRTVGEKAGGEAGLE